MRAIWIIPILVLGLSGCAGFGKSEPVVIDQRVGTIPVFHPPLPDKVNTLPVEWTVLTPDLMAEYLKDLEDGKASARAWYSISPETYRALSENMAELKRYIKEARNVLRYYRENLKRMAPPPEPVPVKKAEAPKPAAPAAAAPTEEARTFALPDVSMPSFLGGESR